MHDRLLIRTALPADATRLAALTTQLGYPARADELEERLARLLRRDDAVVFVAELDGEAIGWLHAAEVEILEHGRRCEILGLVVDAGRRRSGAGRSLVAAAERWGAARGLQQIAVRSNVTRTESHPFYEGLGYERWKTQHAYRKPLPAAGSAGV